jgi:hypothetical protein
MNGSRPLDELAAPARVEAYVGAHPPLVKDNLAMRSLDIRLCRRCFSKMHSKWFDFRQPCCGDCGLPWIGHPRVDVNLLNDNDMNPLKNNGDTLLPSIDRLYQAICYVEFNHECR